MANGVDITYPPLRGRQNVIRGSGTLPDAADPSVPAVITGVAWATGTYNFSIPVDGASSVDIVLRSSAATGTGLTSTASIQATLADGQTLKGAVAQAAAVFVNGTQQVLRLTGLRGERFVNLRLTVPAASTITFDQAEFSTSVIDNPVDTPAADAKAWTGFATPIVAALAWLFNGTAFDRLRAASAAVLGAFSSTGAALVDWPGQWGQAHTPTTATQATTTKAAGAAGVRHVCTGISAALATGATAQAVSAILVLRDGATGAGTILWSKQVILPINSVWNVDLTGLNIVGSAATAMTLEFTAAGAAGTLEAVSLSGYDAS